MTVVGASEGRGDRSAAPAAEVVGPVAVWALAAWLTARGMLSALEWPAIARLVGWMAGDGRPVWWLIIAVALVTIGGYGWRQWSRAAHDVGVLRWGAIAMVMMAIAVGVVGRAVVDRAGPVSDLVDRGGHATMIVTVVREPRPVATGWQVVARVATVNGVATRQHVAFTVDNNPPMLSSRLEVIASARPVPDGGYGRWLRAQRVAAIVDVRSLRHLDGQWWIAASTDTIRDRIRQAAVRHAKPRPAGLLGGLVIGDTRLLPDDDQAAMQATSLTHLTAVSGSHVAIVIAGVAGLLIGLNMPLRARIVTVATVVVWFAILTRFEPSVIRASTMALMVLAVRMRGVVGDARHALASAVLLVLVVNPYLAGSLGLTLSATATAGVLVLTPRIQRRLTAWPRRVGMLAAVTLGAQIAVLPALLATFGEFRLASLPANMIAVPAAMLAAAVSFVASAVAVVSVEVAAVVLWVASWPARIVLWAAHTFADVGGHVDSQRPATVVATTAAATWVLADRGSRVARTSALCAVVAVMVLAAVTVSGSIAPRHLTVTNIDVGQGDAFLIESRHARILVDAGGDHQAARWLTSHGRRSLDVLLVTHPHLDHVGGAADVVRRINVGQVWFRPQPTTIPQVEDLLAAAQERSVPVVVPRVGAQVAVGDLVVEVLHPPSGRPFQAERSELNDTSTVVRVTAPDGRRVLATGDIEIAAQRMLLERAAGQLEAELITVPHHGAATSDAEFLVATRAQVALIGVDADNAYGHPHPDTLAVLAAMGARVIRTDLDGTSRVTVPARRPPRCAHDLASGSRHEPAIHGAPQRYSRGHGQCRVDRRRRRSAVASPRRTVGGSGPIRRSRHRREPVRRHRDRPSSGTANHVTVRRPILHDPAGCRTGIGHAQART